MTLKFVKFPYLHIQTFDRHTLLRLSNVNFFLSFRFGVFAELNQSAHG
jgi:hypothetical protein